MRPRCVHLLDPPLCLAAHAKPVELPLACDSCRHYRGSPRGIGDVIKTVADVTGISAAVDSLVGDCGCQGRRESLNSMFPFGKDDRPAS